MNFTIGSDPEFFLTLGCNPKSASSFPKKESAYLEHNNSFYQENGYLESNISPAKTKEDFKYNIYNALFSIKNLISPRTISQKCFIEFPETELADKNYKINNQYCIYNGKKIFYNKQTNKRTCAGHIHLSFDEIPEYESIIKLLDLFLAIPFVLIEKNNNAKERKKIYGKAGTYRYPLHGVEYCTLSNYWLFSPLFVDIVYDLCEFTINFVEEKQNNSLWNKNCCVGYNLEKLIRTINEHDVQSAEKFYLLIQNYLPERIIYNIEKALRKNTIDIYQEWKI